MLLGGARLLFPLLALILGLAAIAGGLFLSRQRRAQTHMHAKDNDTQEPASVGAK